MSYNNGNPDGLNEPKNSGYHRAANNRLTEGPDIWDGAEGIIEDCYENGMSPEDAADMANDAFWHQLDDD